MAAVLSVKDLCFSYGPIEVLCGITFAVEPGDYLALAGPNGAGKTTLVKTILGLTERYRGTVELFGRRPEQLRDTWRVGYLPQRVTAFNPLFPATVREVVGIGLMSRKSFPRRLNQHDAVRVRQALELMAITDLKDRLVGNLSGGQQQRVFLARALVSDPELLILDEPSTALDAQSREDFFELLLRLNRERKMAIILISHDISTVARYAGRLLYLDKHIIYDGRFADFCESDLQGQHPGVCPNQEPEPIQPS
jgi:zinc transport system ATP-binding protein